MAVTFSAFKLISPPKLHGKYELSGNSHRICECSEKKNKIHCQKTPINERIVSG